MMPARFNRSKTSNPPTTPDWGLEQTYGEFDDLSEEEVDQLLDALNPERPANLHVGEDNADGLPQHPPEAAALANALLARAHTLLKVPVSDGTDLASIRRTEQLIGVILIYQHMREQLKPSRAASRAKLRRLLNYAESFLNELRMLDVGEKLDLVHTNLLGPADGEVERAYG